MFACAIRTDRQTEYRKYQGFTFNKVQYRIDKHLVNKSSCENSSILSISSEEILLQKRTILFECVF